MLRMGSATRHSAKIDEAADISIALAVLADRRGLMGRGPLSCKRAKTPYILMLSTWHSGYLYYRIFGDPGVE